MRDMDAHIKGFDYTTCHVYQTEVVVDDHTWTLDLRYNTFYLFYERLVAVEKHFPVAFPPKRGLLFSPPPETRQEQLNEFLLGTLAYFDMRGRPKRMAALLDELLEVSTHLGSNKKEVDDEDRTASEGSSEEHDDFLESSGQEEDETRARLPLAADVEVGGLEVARKEPVGALSAHVPIACVSAPVGLASGESSIAADGGKARGDTASTTVAEGASWAAEGNVEPEPENEEVTETEGEGTQAEEDCRRPEGDYPVVKWLRRLSTFSSCSIDHEEPEAAEKTKRQEEQEAAAREAEAKEVAARVEAEEAAARAEADEAARAEAEAKEAAAREAEEAAAMAREEAEEKARVEALRAEVLCAEAERNLRLKRYRQPVFFRNFRCDVGTSCYSVA